MVDANRPGVHLVLLGGFEVVCDGMGLRLPLGAQRLLAFLALQDSGVHRSVAAERLWPDCVPARASANLRSALWQGRRLGGSTVIECVGPRLRLSDTVRVDHRVASERVRTITGADRPMDDLDGHREIIRTLSHSMVPDWSDEWLLLQRERWDQARLHALETLARGLMAAEDYLTALDAALVAIAIEPVRESTHRTLTEIYIAEGNSASAVKHYYQYRALLQRELGVMPSPRMTRLIQSLTSDRL